LSYLGFSYLTLNLCNQNPSYLYPMVRPKKHLGQHFLKEPAIAQRIAQSISGEGYNTLLEIGPGTGVLTQFLVERKEALKVIEIDVESVAFLQEHFPALEIIEGDFLHLKLDRITPEPLAIVGNFPYNISSQIVFKALENRQQVVELTGMFQKEVAERIAAQPGNKTYGILSVLCSAFYEREYLFTVEPGVFNPPPKVKSGVIRLIRKEDFKLSCDEKLFFTVVKTAFNQRRKTLRNALKTFNLGELIPGNELLGKRAEQLGLEEFIYLTQSIGNK